MAPEAYVLISSEKGEEIDVLNSLQKIESVKESYYSFSFYDVIAKVYGENMGGLKDNIVKIRGVEGVKSAVTCIVIEQ